MTNRESESTVNDELSSALQQLHIYDAIVVAASDAHAVLDAILGAPDHEAAHVALRRRYGFTEVQGWAVMEVQFRRMTATDRAKIKQRRDELAALVADLRAVSDEPRGAATQPTITAAAPHAPPGSRSRPGPGTPSRGRRPDRRPAS